MSLGLPAVSEYEEESTTTGLEAAFEGYSIDSVADYPG